ncbi:radical SAM protein [Thermosulfuriphilus sp.]
MRHPAGPPYLVFANKKGEIFEFPGLLALGRSGYDLLLPQKEDFIPLPYGSELFVLPDRHPIGLDPESGEPVALTENPYSASEPALAVAAFVAPAHTHTHLAAWEKALEDLPPLPLFAYSAVGWRDGDFWVTAFRSDPDPRQDLDHFDPEEVTQRTQKRLRAFAHNRLIQHLGQRCCLTYGCPAARNYFLDRYEAPLPTSRHCNARCLGCLSLQPPEGPPATQERIDFLPSPEEIAEVAGGHLLRAQPGIVSFGQGCEGEPLLEAKLLEKTIRLIRQRTTRGTINLNTNASLPEAVARLALAGLDSMRVSLPSARSRYWQAYVRPRNFGLEDIRASIREMKKKGRFVSLNYFIFPGISDEEEELEALSEIVSLGVDFIQLRNLNIDPDWYLEGLGYSHRGKALGIKEMIAILKKRFPELKFGYFNPYLG